MTAKTRDMQRMEGQILALQVLLTEAVWTLTRTAAVPDLALASYLQGAPRAVERVLLAGDFPRAHQDGARTTAEAICGALVDTLARGGVRPGNS